MNPVKDSCDIPQSEKSYRDFSSQKDMEELVGDQLSLQESVPIELDDKELAVSSKSGAGEHLNSFDESKCQDVSLDRLSIQDKSDVPCDEPKSPTVSKPKIELKSHDARKKLSTSFSENDDIIKMRKMTPKVNCPEKIVLCIDMSSELEDITFKLGDGRKYSGFCMAKRILEIFVHTKHRIDKQHEFALVILNETSVLLRNFTSDPRDICNVLEDLRETQLCASCDLMSLFSNLCEKIILPEVADPSVLPPPYLVRCILIYGRSNCIPDIDLENQLLKKLQSSHYFFFDVLYIHQQPSNENKCQEVFQKMCDFDQNYTSYIFEVSQNPTKLHNYMAMLLAHPLQRPPQSEARYKLKDEVNVAEQTQEQVE